MYSPRTRQGKANLYKTDKNTLTVNLPVSIAKNIYGKSRKRISLYLKADSNENMGKALQHLDKIQSFIEVEDWQGLIDYETNLKPKVIKGNFQKRNLKEFWNEYVIAKSPSWEASYIENDIKQTTRILNNCPGIVLNEELEPLINYLLATTTTKQTKRYLKQVSACLTWGVRRRIIKENPLPDFIRTLTTKKKNDDDLDINPFTREERDTIIEAFRSGKHERFQNSHKKYADYVEFSFYTGARTSEVLGLKWNHIDFNSKIITFQEAKVLATNTKAVTTSVQKQGLKTQKKRMFPMNDRLFNLLEERKKTIQPDDLEENVFKDISHHAFRSGVYKNLLKKLDIDYRKPYQMRHTFITVMANYSDLKLHQIARICGTSIGVIENHYLGTSLTINTLPDV